MSLLVETNALNIAWDNKKNNTYPRGKYLPIQILRVD